MNETLLSLRKRVLFPEPGTGFHDECSSIRNTLQREHERLGPQDREQTASLLAELTIDLGSYLSRWVLLKHTTESAVTQVDIDDEVEENCGLLRSWNLEETVSHVRAEIDSIRRSNFVRISDLTDRGELNTRWGNDSAVGLTRAVRRGAVLVTTNPVMVNSVRKEDPETWNAVRNRTWGSFPESAPQEIASLITMEVVLRNCQEMRPIFEATQEKFGYVCLQINPKNCSDSIKMAEEAEMLYERLGSELDGTPNTAFKVPGTKAGLETAQRLTRKGICVTITASASVAQLVEFAKIIEAGRARTSYLTVMSGRLDDPIREELNDAGMEDHAEIATWASTAVTRKAYSLIYDRMGFKKSTFLIASIRGPWNIDRCMTDGDSGLVITVFPDKAAIYDKEPRNTEAHIRDPIPAEIVEKLNRSAIFRKAHDESLLPADEFDSFYPVEATMRQFISNYEEFLAYIGEDRR